MTARGLTVVCARVLTEHVPTGVWRHDIGERPALRAVRVPVAVVWINCGTPADLARAHAWCVAEGGGWRAAPVPAEHRSDPLAWARDWALAMPPGGA